MLNFLDVDYYHAYDEDESAFELDLRHLTEEQLREVIARGNYYPEPYESAETFIKAIPTPVDFHFPKVRFAMYAKWKIDGKPELFFYYEDGKRIIIELNDVEQEYLDKLIQRESKQLLKGKFAIARKDYINSKRSLKLAYADPEKLEKHLIATEMFCRDYVKQAMDNFEEENEELKKNDFITFTRRLEAYPSVAESNAMYMYVYERDSSSGYTDVDEYDSNEKYFQEWVANIDENDTDEMIRAIDEACDEQDEELVERYFYQIAANTNDTFRKLFLEKVNATEDEFLINKANDMMDASIGSRGEMMLR